MCISAFQVSTPRQMQTRARNKVILTTDCELCLYIYICTYTICLFDATLPFPAVVRVAGVTVMPSDLLTIAVWRKQSRKHKHTRKHKRRKHKRQTYMTTDTTLMRYTLLHITTSGV